MYSRKRFNHTLYTLKKIDWFGIKVNIKIEGYVEVFSMVGKL